MAEMVLGMIPGANIEKDNLLNFLTLSKSKSGCQCYCGSFQLQTVFFSDSECSENHLSAKLFWRSGNGSDAMGLMAQKRV